MEYPHAQGAKNNLVLAKCFLMIFIQMRVKMAIAPSFFAITDSNLSPVSLQITPIPSHIMVCTSQSNQEVNKLGFG